MWWANEQESMNGTDRDTDRDADVEVARLFEIRELDFNMRKMPLSSEKGYEGDCEDSL